jgi:hypothetical protein
VGEYPESYPALGNWPGYGYVTPPPGEPPAPSDPVPPASPPPGNRKWMWISLTLAALLVLVVIGAGLAWTAQTISSQTSTTTSTIAAPPPPIFAPPPMSPPLCPPAVAGPLTPAGWQPVSSPFGLAYDVPADWKVNDCSTMLGWEKYCAGGPFGTCPIEVLNGSAELSDPLCPNGWRAVTGLDGRTDSKDIGREARAKSSLVGDIYTSESGRKPTVSLGDPRTMTIDGAPAVEVLATVTHIEQDQCHGPGALHSVVATSVPGGKGVVVFVVSIGQGYPGAPAAGLVDQVIGTLRHN